MRAYIISVAGAAVISAVVNMLSPERWTKYISIITGLVIAICIGRPIFELIGSDALADLGTLSGSIPAADTGVYYDEIRRELEARLAADIKERMKNEFGTDCETSAEVGMDPAGGVRGVKRITIRGGHADNVAAARLREIYGAEEVIFSEKLY